MRNFVFVVLLALFVAPLFVLGPAAQRERLERAALMGVPRKSSR